MHNLGDATNRAPGTGGDAAAAAEILDMVRAVTGQLPLAVNDDAARDAGDAERDDRADSTESPADARDATGEQTDAAEPAEQPTASQVAENAEPTSHVPPSGWLLAIDSSSHAASIALAQVDAGGLTGAGGELVWPVGREGTVMLLAQIDHLLSICHCTAADLVGIVVTTGPGGFNALRVGMSVAKGLAFANDLPLYGVPTLDVAARAVAGWGLPVRAFNTAGRRRVVFTDYHPVGGFMTQVGEYAHRAPDDLAADLSAPTVLVGELSAADEAALRDFPLVILPDHALRRRRAALALDIVLPRWLEGAADPLETLEPLYLHTVPAPAPAAPTASPTTTAPTTDVAAGGAPRA